MKSSRSTKKIQEALGRSFIRRKRFLIYVMTNTSGHYMSNISVVVRKYLDIWLNVVKDLF